jgi:hypothetical protein
VCQKTCIDVNFYLKCFLQFLYHSLPFHIPSKYPSNHSNFTSSCTIGPVTLVQRKPTTTNMSGHALFVRYNSLVTVVWNNFCLIGNASAYLLTMNSSLSPGTKYSFNPS